MILSWASTKSTGVIDDSSHAGQKPILTYHGEESGVELTSQNARWELAHECLEQSRNGVWIPVLIRSKQVDISLCELICINAVFSNSGHGGADVPELKRSLRLLMTAELPLSL